MSQVMLQDVRKVFGKAEVLHGLTLDIDEGEFVVLVGPSGCGKSTLLRMLAGLEEISGGEIAIGDVIVNDVPAKERNIAMVFQNYALYPHMTVAENMGFALKIARINKDEIHRRVMDAAASLGLEPFLDRYPRQLSGGQRQRVAMGRAIVRDPEVFLFDEPLSNLDAKLRVQMRVEIGALHQRLRTTTVYVTHDQVEAMTMADKIVVMNDGNIEQIGAPLELYDSPKNLFVAGFIGSPVMNFFEGKLTGRSEFMSASGVAMPVRTDIPDTEEDVVIGVRPEHWLLNGEEGITGKVVVVEPTGAETLVVFQCGGQNVTVTSRERITVKPGDKIGVSPDLSRMHVFDKKTGLNLSATA